MSEINVSDYLNIYLDELEDQLQILDEELLNLERNGTSNRSIESIFRAAHTLKGSSAAMGFTQIQQLTHHMENVFDHIRNGLLTVDSTILKVIFHTVDYLKELHQAIIDGNIESYDIEPIVHQLEQLLSKFIGTVQTPIIETTSNQAIHHQIEQWLVSLDQYQKDIILHAQQSGNQAIVVYGRVASDSEMQVARAFLLHNQCQTIGEVIAANPAIELMEQENGFSGDVAFIVLTQVTEQVIHEQLDQISQFEFLKFLPINLDQMGTAHYNVHKETSLIQMEDKQIEQAPESKGRVSQTIRVDVNRLEQLLNYVGELIIDNVRLQEVKNRLMSRFEDHADLHLLHDISNHLTRVIGELQEGMMKTRMMPIEQLFNRFPRMVRDIAENLNKEIDFIIQGKETELDRTLIEEISDPIIHLLRNSADHGIESPEEREKLGKPRRGKLILKAAHQENQIVITIADDGRGIDPEKIKSRAIQKGFVTEERAGRMTAKELVFLIFKSGMSTAESVTEISGRGVGMDIVRAQIEKLSGIIDIDTSIGEGTLFTIKLPLTLAINRSLLVQFGLTTFAIPLVNVVETVRIHKDAIKTIQGQEVCIIRGTVFRVVRMNEYMNLSEPDPIVKENQSKGSISIVIVGVADQRVCLVVDHLIGNQEIVIKPLGSYLGKVPYIAGGTILGDGNVALILDAASFVRDAGSKTLLGEMSEEPLQKLSKELQFITFELKSEQYALEINQVKEIIKVPKITEISTASKNVLGIINLRGKLVPVFDLRRCLNMSSQGIAPNSRIMIVEVEKQDIGILVDQVTEVLKLQQDEIEDPPSHLVQQNTKIIRGVYKTEDRFVILLGLDGILNLNDLDVLLEESYT